VSCVGRESVPLTVLNAAGGDGSAGRTSIAGDEGSANLPAAAAGVTSQGAWLEGVATSG
jgi:hypothetical protein